MHATPHLCQSTEPEELYILARAYQADSRNVDSCTVSPHPEQVIKYSFTTTKDFAKCFGSFT
jgi:hypothetical protein